MASEHTEKAMTVTVPDRVKANAQNTLNERGRDMRAFIEASLAAVHENPDRVLKILTPHWPPPKPRGRPVAKSSEVVVDEDKGITVRVRNDVKINAQKTLKDQCGRGLRAFIEAILTAVHTDTNRVLRTLDPHWPPARRRGRPLPEPEQILDLMSDGHRKALHVIASADGPVVSPNAYSEEIYGKRAVFTALTRWGAIETVKIRRTKKKRGGGEVLLGSHYETALTDFGHKLANSMKA
ncbi:hypothetical protein [Mycobacteroides abscessus]|uniref:hypothetical protein n=1 Tax=Mycobacteroides abscessus TaxID=36809 RepID=UPI00192E6F50|nr:hypothetical protein [Mycobacteroides abscessus]